MKQFDYSELAEFEPAEAFRQNCADDPQTRRAGDVGDDVVELKISPPSTPLHVLNM